MIGEAPERHQSRINRETRKGDMKEAETRQKELIEKHGESTDTVQSPDGKTHEVNGADCPDCSGVIVVVPSHDTYPPWEESCTGDCDR